MNQATSYSCNEKPFNTCHSTPLYNPSPFIALFFTFHQIPCYNLMEESRNAQYSKGQQSSDELPRSHKVVKAATAATAGGSLLVLSGLTMAGTVIGLAVVTPLFVIFSPVLVPAAITVSLLIVGFLATGGFGVAAMVVLSWFFRYMAGKGRDVGGDLPEKGRYRFGGKGRSELEG